MSGIDFEMASRIPEGWRRRRGGGYCARKKVEVHLHMKRGRVRGGRVVWWSTYLGIQPDDFRWFGASWKFGGSGGGGSAAASNCLPAARHNRTLKATTLISCLHSLLLASRRLWALSHWRHESSGANAALVLHHQVDCEWRADKKSIDRTTPVCVIVSVQTLSSSYPPLGSAIRHSRRLPQEPPQVHPATIPADWYNLGLWTVKPNRSMAFVALPLQWTKLDGEAKIAGDWSWPTRLIVFDRSKEESAPVSPATSQWPYLGLVGDVAGMVR